MKQTSERRGDPRRPAAFTLWYQRPGRQDWLGGWAMNISSGGVAAIVPPDESPRLGEVVRLVPLTPPSPIAAAAVPAGLPAAGRVVRVDPRDGLTRQIAIAFEADVASSLDADGVHEAAVSNRRPEPAVKSAASIAYGARRMTRDASVDSF